MDVFSGLIRGSREYLRDAASAAAHRLGVFAAVPCPAAALAGRLGVQPRRLAALVRVLLLDGALAEIDGTLRAAAVPPFRPVARGGWGDLAEVIRGDRPLAGAAIAGESGDDLRRFHDHLWSAGSVAAREVAERLPRGSLLDAGGGAGVYAEAFLAAHPGERVTIADRPAVLELAAVRVPAAARVALDLLADGDWPSGARIALLANVLHLYGPVDGARLVARAAGAVAPGGTVAIVDFDASSQTGILFSLNMALFTESGDVHDATRLRSWLEAAGARELRVDRLRCSPDTLLVTGRVAAAHDAAREPPIDLGAD